jgi:membrane protease YdiL (CAAX protease family)
MFKICNESGFTILKYLNLYLVSLYIISMILMLSYHLLVLIIYDFFYDIEALDASHINKTEFVISNIIAPLLETYIFQYLFFKYVVKIINGKLLTAIVSSMLFSVLHTTEIIYVLVYFVFGMYFCFVYNLFESHWRGFWHTAGIHALYNFTVHCLYTLG